MPIVRDEWEYDLSPVHRALLDLCRERTTRIEHIAFEGMSEAQLAAELVCFLREEYVTIPKGTPVVPCPMCGALVCRIPFDHPQYRTSFVVDGPECYPPTADARGYGFHHLAVCGGLVQIAAQRFMSDAADRESPAAEPARAVA